jgi:predicted ATPase
LATSRAILRVLGEQTYAVPSLAWPDPDRLPELETLLAFPAVDLFVQRAAAARSGFRLTAGNAPAVAAICARVDGLPLALELAAARVRLLPPSALLARLGRRLPLLVGGARDQPARLQTMREAIAWSNDLLGPGERALFRRLAVFAGGCTLEAAEAVCRLDDRLEVLEGLAELADQSLLRSEEQPDGDVRLMLLETIREYGLERLDAAEEAATTRDRHLAWCVALAEEAAPHLLGPEQGRWLVRLEVEHDNLRAALGWSLRSGGDPALGLRLAGALWRFWQTRGYLTEGRGWLEEALASDQPAPSAARARALDGAGNLAETQGDYGQAIAFYEEALALRRGLGDKQGIAGSLNDLGNVAYWQGDYGRALALHEQSLALKRELGDRSDIAISLNNLGLAAYRQGDYDRAAALYEESLALKRALGNTRGIAVSLHNLGAVASSQADYARAAALHEESLALTRELGDSYGIAILLNNLGNVAGWQGDHERAIALLREALLRSRDLGARELMAEALEGLAWVAAAGRQAQRAARFGGAAEALREALGVPLLPEQQADHDQAVQAMRAMLGEGDFAAAWAEGRALPLEAAIGLALEAATST